MTAILWTDRIMEALSHAPHGLSHEDLTRRAGIAGFPDALVMQHLTGLVRAGTLTHRSIRAGGKPRVIWQLTRWHNRRIYGPIAWIPNVVTQLERLGGRSPKTPQRLEQIAKKALPPFDQSIREIAAKYRAGATDVGPDIRQLIERMLTTVPDLATGLCDDRATATASVSPPEWQRAPANRKAPPGFAGATP